MFLKEALRRLLERDAEGSGKTDKELLTLTCAELQIALELAMRAVVIWRDGIGAVLKSDQKGLKEADIIRHYNNKTLKVEDFEKLKNYLKKRGGTSLKKNEFDDIERFQTYRNKIVHFACEFSDENLQTFRNEILYYIVHVVLVLLSEETTGETPAEYLQSKLGDDFYKRVKDYNPYVNAMERYAARLADPVWTCIGCFHRTYTPKDDYRYICGYETLAGYRRVDCGACGAKDSVIYDNWNVHNEGNHHTMRGMCLVCEEDTYVFEYPVCGEAHDTTKNFEREYCDENHCVNK